MKRQALLLLRRAVVVAQWARWRENGRWTVNTSLPPNSNPCWFAEDIGAPVMSARLQPRKLRSPVRGELYYARFFNVIGAFQLAAESRPSSTARRPRACAFGPTRKCAPAWHGADIPRGAHHA